MAIFGPHRIKTLKPIKPIFAQLITSSRSPSLPNFIKIGQAVAPPHGWSWRLPLFFFSNLSRARAKPTLGARPPNIIYQLMRLGPKMCFLGFHHHGASHGNNPQPPQFWVGNSDFPLKRFTLYLKNKLMYHNACIAENVHLGKTHNKQSEKFWNRSVWGSNLQKTPLKGKPSQKQWHNGNSSITCEC
jgi:hypothetical protein